MMKCVKDIVREGRELSRALKMECSTRLSAVRDGSVGVVVPSWRSADSRDDHKIHRMMSRVGGFPPALARYFIARFSKVGDAVLDPFCGKGTTLFEAMQMGRKAIGGDIAPDAVLVSRAKCRPVKIVDVANYIQKLNVEDEHDLSEVPSDVSLFFSEKTLAEILTIRAQLFQDMKKQKTRDVATFVCGVMLGLLHGHSRLSLSLPCNQAFAMSPAYVRKYVKEHGLRRPRRDVRKCLLEKSLELLPFPRFESVSHVATAPANRCHDYVVEVARQADLVLTSPPYLARQTYIKDSWLRTWFLGAKREAQAAATLETGNVVKFVAGMERSLHSMARSVKNGGRIVLVCGRAKVTFEGKGHSVAIADLCLYAMANSPVLHKALVPEHLIRDRVMMKRGSYFAVHHGKVDNGNGEKTRRFGEDEILVVRKDQSVRKPPEG
jgi:DNA modification methylase